MNMGSPVPAAWMRTRLAGEALSMAVFFSISTLPVGAVMVIVRSRWRFRVMTGSVTSTVLSL